MARGEEGEGEKTVAMPVVPAEVWIQFSIVAILLAAAGGIAGGFYRLWHELLGWMEDHDTRREAEREKQRSWQADLSLKRDAEMQAFMRGMLEQWEQDETRSWAVMERLVAKVDDLTGLAKEHDTWERAVKVVTETRRSRNG